MEDEGWTCAGGAERDACLNGLDITTTKYPDLVCAALIVIIAIVAFLGSAVFLSTLFRLRGRRISSHLFMGSLVLSDILVAVFSMPIAVGILLNGRKMPTTPDDKFNKYLQGFSHFIGRQASLGSLCVIVVDRFIAVRTPFRYKQVVTSRVAVVCCLIVWGQAVLISFWPWFERLDPCFLLENPSVKARSLYELLDRYYFIYASWMPTCEWTAQKYGFYVFIPTFGVTLLLVCSLSIFLTFRLFFIQQTMRGKERSFRYATITTLYVSVVFLFCYTLRHLFPIILKQHLSCEAKGIIAAYMTCVIYLNSAVNPAIYILRGKILKRETVVMLASVGQDVWGIMSGIVEEVSINNTERNMIKRNSSPTRPINGASPCFIHSGFVRRRSLIQMDTSPHQSHRISPRGRSGSLVVLSPLHDHAGTLMRNPSLKESSRVEIEMDILKEESGEHGS